MSSSLGNAVTQEKTVLLDGAGDVCARGSVATVHARQAGQLLKCGRHFLVLTNVLVLPLSALTSDRHALRHKVIAASPFEAICTEISISPPGALLS
eukprot:1778583-Pleurochrysis_carterae.AAC.1